MSISWSTELSYNLLGLKYYCMCPESGWMCIFFVLKENLWGIWYMKQKCQSKCTNYGRSEIVETIFINIICIGAGIAQ